MKQGKKNIAGVAVSADSEKKYWLQVFAVYAAAEILFIAISSYTTWSQCKQCIQPVSFYISKWVAKVLLTAMAWYGLNIFYHKPLLKIIAANIFIFIIYYFLWIATLYFMINAGIDWLASSDSSHRSFTYIIHWSWADIGEYVLRASVFYMLKFYIEYRKAAHQHVQLAVINKEMQLNLMKQQLSPHFYFNTLNNLYGLARSNNPGLSPALNQLSNIMQYVITDCNKPEVMLEQEIDFLKSYIELEKLRYEKGTLIEMKVNGTVSGQTILPLLLIQFVENAFKHGMKEKSDRNWIKVNMDIDGKELLFKVENSFYDGTPSQGIGINSVKHILNLQYENRYDIQMLHDYNRFSVILKLSL